MSGAGIRVHNYDHGPQAIGDRVEVVCDHEGSFAYARRGTRGVIVGNGSSLDWSVKLDDDHFPREFTCCELYVFDVVERLAELA